MDWTWSLERIQQLAPDTLTLERARALLKPRRWALLAVQPPLIWGECRTSGAIRYRSAFDWERQLFYSNSPAPIKPDKYLLALLLQYFQDPANFKSQKDVPDWVEKGLHGPISGTDPIDKAALKAAQRMRAYEKRIAVMTDGARDLGAWLEDASRRGIGALQTQNDDFWENIAARLVDCKLSGLAKRIRQLKDSRQESDWEHNFMRQIADLYLWVEGFSRLDELPEPLQHELLTVGGLALRKEEVLQEEPVSGYWLVAGQVSGVEDKLRFRRTWLWGENTQMPALLLDYAWGEQPFEQEWTPGTALQGDLCFYPSSYPLRAIVSTFHLDKRPFLAGGGIKTLNELNAVFATAVAKNPWLEKLPVMLEDMAVIRHDQEAILVDKLNCWTALRAEGVQAWRLLAISGGRPVQIFGEWDGEALRPMSALVDSRFIQI